MARVLFSLVAAIPFAIKKHRYYDKNEYANANSLGEQTCVMPHNGSMS